MKGITKLIVEEDAIDELNHVNNAVYIKYLEKGRTDWYKDLARFSEDEKLKENLSTVVLHLDVLFKKEAVLGDVLTIVTRPKKLGTKSFVVEQKIYNEKDELLTEATVTSVMFDTKARKSIPVVSEIAKAFEEI